MKSLSIVPALLFGVGLVCAQDKPPEAAPKTENYEAAIIPIKVLTGDSFDRLAKLIGVFNVRYVADDKLRTIVVYAPKDVVAQVRKVVEQLDQPGSEAAIGRNIDMTLSFLRCSTKAPTQPSALPADLESVAKQLRSVTQYKDIELWDTVPLRAQEGKDTEESIRLPSVLPSDFKGAQSIGQIKVHPESVVRKDQGRSVRFSTLRFNFRIPYVTGSFPAGTAAASTSYQYSYLDVGLTTSGDLVEGQKTVLGKVSGIDDDSSIFVVISLKVLD
jgi:type II/III secretion system protein